MRVLVMCDWFLKVAVPQVRALAAAGADVALLHRDHAQEFANDFAERDRYIEAAACSGVQIMTLRGRISDMRSLAKSARLARSIRTWRPDVAHAHDNVDPRLLAIAWPHRLVLTVHDPVPHPGQPLRGPAKRVIRTAWLRRARRVVVHGEELRDELPPEVDRGRVVVIPHGLDPAAAAMPVPEAAAVLFFGRLQPYKGLGVLVAAMEHVWRTRPDVKLLVYGDGPEAAVVPTDPRVELHAAYVAESEVDDVFARASLVVLPYVQASQSGVGLLALARGIPVVVSDVGALAELALDRRFVVPPGDPAALAEAIVSHLAHDARLRNETLARGAAEFSWATVADRSLGLYRDIAIGQDR